MKKFFVVFLGVFATTAAFACPDFSGQYHWKSDDQSPSLALVVEQQGCQTVAFTLSAGDQSTQTILTTDNVARDLPDGSQRTSTFYSTNELDDFLFDKDGDLTETICILKPGENGAKDVLQMQTLDTGNSVTVDFTRD